MSGGQGREPAQQNLDQLGHADRLGNVIVQARIERLLTVTSQGMGGDGNDRQIGGRKARICADLSGGLVAIHTGHLDVHQHHFKLARHDHLNGGLAVVGDENLHPQVFQHIGHHQLVDFIVFHQQNLPSA